MLGLAQFLSQHSVSWASPGASRRVGRPRRRCWKSSVTRCYQGAPKLAALAAEIASVPCIVVEYADPLDERAAIIEFNRYRLKNGQQLYNEGHKVEAIEEESARARQWARTDLPNIPEMFPEGQRGENRDAVAEAIGLGSGRQWDKLFSKQRGRYTCNLHSHTHRALRRRVSV